MTKDKGQGMKAKGRMTKFVHRESFSVKPELIRGSWFLAPGSWTAHREPLPATGGRRANSGDLSLDFGTVSW